MISITITAIAVMVMRFDNHHHHRKFEVNRGETAVNLTVAALA